MNEFRFKTMAQYRREVARREVAHPGYKPSAKQIAEGCERIRTGWKETDSRQADVEFAPVLGLKLP